MTTIAFKDNILAADTLITSDGYVFGHCSKIERVGRLRLGSTGTAAMWERFRDWVRNGMKGDHALKGEEDEGVAFVVEPDGRTVCWCNTGPYLILGTCWGLGSGHYHAHGAMLAGATAEEAVRHAMTIDTCSGGSVTVLGPPAEAYSAPILQFRPHRSNAEAWAERMNTALVRDALDSGFRLGH